MVVVATVLVVGPDEHGLRPVGAGHDRVDHLAHELIAELDVLGILLGLFVVVGLHQAVGGEVAGRGVDVELVDGANPSTSV